MSRTQYPYILQFHLLAEKSANKLFMEQESQNQTVIDFKMWIIQKLHQMINK